MTNKQIFSFTNYIGVRSAPSGKARGSAKQGWNKYRPVLNQLHWKMVPNTANVDLVIIKGLVHQ